MKKGFFRTVTLFLTLLLMLFCPVTTYARSLPDEIIITDTQSLKVVPGGEYFYNIHDMLPGDSFDKNFQVDNTDTAHSYDLYFKTEPIEFSGDLNLLEEIELQIYYNDKLIYTGPLSGNGKGGDGSLINTNNNVMHLSKLTPGTHDVIRTEVYLDGEKIGNEWQKAHCIMRWIFTAVREEQSTTGGINWGDPNNFNNPSTGDEIKYLPYIIAANVVSIPILVFILMKKRKERLNAPKRRK